VGLGIPPDDALARGRHGGSCQNNPLVRLSAVSSRPRQPWELRIPLDDALAKGRRGSRLLRPDYLLLRLPAVGDNAAMDRRRLRREFSRAGIMCRMARRLSKTIVIVVVVAALAMYIAFWVYLLVFQPDQVIVPLFK
jgi:hypothetical protein